MRLQVILSVLILGFCPQLPATDHYSGTVSAVQRNGELAETKSFSVDLVTIGESPHEVLFIVEESSPKLPALERMGLLTGWLRSGGPAIAYRHRERTSVLALGVPQFPLHEASEDPVVGLAWETEQGKFHIVQEVVEHGHPCWVIEVETGVARRHRYIVRQDLGLVESASQTVILGQGDRFQINLQRRPDALDPAADENASSYAELGRLLPTLRTTITRKESERGNELTISQIDQLAPMTEELQVAATETAAEKVVGELVAEIQAAQNRQGKIREVAHALLGKKPSPFTLHSLDGTDIPSSSFNGQPTVLHFWDYAESQLEQPYGQVSYLDFVSRRFQDRNVLVYGVAIDPRLSDPETRKAALVDIRKFQSFLKFAYPVTTDAGAALNTLGNPTRFGESLPVWVILAPDGSVAHYSTGFYEVDPEVGLRELTTVLEQLTSSQP